MSTNKKHKYLRVQPQQKNEGIRYGTGPRPRGDRTNENDDSIDDESLIYDRRKENISTSISNININLTDNINRLQATINKYELDQDSTEIIQSETKHILKIFFYKQCSEHLLETIVRKLTSLLGNENIRYIRNINLNFGILISVTSSGLNILLDNLRKVLSATNWDDEELSRLPNEIKLIKHILLQKFEDKFASNKSITNECIFPIKGNINFTYIDLIKDAVGITYEKIYEIAEYSYIKITGSPQSIIDFIILFNGQEFAFSELRTTIGTSGPYVDIRKTVTTPAISQSADKLPLIYLLDSGFPRMIENLNPLIAPFAKGNDAVSELGENPDPVKDHAIQMAGIIIYGEKLNNINEDLLYDNGLVAHADIYSVMIGAEKPCIGLYTIPELLTELKGRGEEQDIKICNGSFNLETTDDEIDIHFMTYLIDLFLFFNPKYLYIGSVGNYEQIPNDRRDLIDDLHIGGNLNLFSDIDSNISSPSEGLNIFSVGALEKCGTILGGESEIAAYTRKSKVDSGIIKNNIHMKRDIDNMNTIKRISYGIIKPDILSPGSSRRSSCQDSSLEIFTPEERSGSSHAAAYISHIAAKIVSEYPELKLGTSIEALIIHFAEKINNRYKIDESKFLGPHIRGRISYTKDRTNINLHEKVIEKEGCIMFNRLSGRGAINPEKVIINSNNAKTIIIEGTIEIGKEQIQKINLLDYIEASILDRHKTKIYGTICFRGLPNIDGGMGYNMINIQAGFSFTEDVPKGKRSGRDYCSHGIWNNRENIPTLTMKRGSDNISGRNYNHMIAKEHIFNVHTKCIHRRKTERLITQTVNSYLSTNPIESEQDSLYFSRALNIPYSIIITIESTINIDLYAELTGEIQLSSSAPTQESLF